MKASIISFKSVRIPIPKPTVKPYEVPPLSSISVEQLPNNGFGLKNYHISKTKFGEWPVYKKIQNTKVTTEVKRIKGDLDQFKKDLTNACSFINAQNVTINKKAGYLNIKGDVVEKVKRSLDESLT